jgi:hypothetical protein
MIEHKPEATQIKDHTCGDFGQSIKVKYEEKN